ncbi:hypothetical protein RIF29_18981 [Crotalaria pallida]|uniref:Kinesin motor domain-containing protein n=1 Tax=Crotalaria pallida TaxID=3830 RepID=A0AAN9F297_CROPI
MVIVVIQLQSILQYVNISALIAFAVLFGKVIIRMRPLSNAEISVQGYSKCVKQESCQPITWTGHPESQFTFDVVADENVSQEKLFKVAGIPMVENCTGGYNSCMFAYGQTGSGKTHTMLGDIEGGTRRHSVNCGMTPRIFEHLFSRIQKMNNKYKACNGIWKLRKIFQVDPTDYVLAICGDMSLGEFSSHGKSGSFFYLTQDDRFMIKTVKKSEVKGLITVGVVWCPPHYAEKITRHEEELGEKDKELNLTW